MKTPFIHNPMAIFIAIGLIVISTVALSFLNYHYTVGGENLIKSSLIQSNTNLALHYVDRIEQRIIDNDRALSEMIDVDINDPSKWPSLAENIRKADLNVDQVYFLQPNGNILYPHPHDNRNQWKAFQSSFVVKELDIEHLALDQPHHLHREGPGGFFFATFILKETHPKETHLKETHKKKRILICFQMSFDSIMAMLDTYLRVLQNNYYVSIVDFENKGIYGQPISRTSGYFIEARFQSTLYKWLLHLLPRKYIEIEQDVRNRRRTNLFFIILSMSLIFISLAIIYVELRRDRQLRQLKEDFIGNVSHELKTPLSLIRMFSEILVTGRIKDEDKKFDYFRIIHNESDRMSRLINNLLDFANLGRGIHAGHFEKINLAQLVAKALEAYRYEIQKDGFQIDLDARPDVPDSFADPNALTMAFLNLLDNSVKYSLDPKQIEVRVERTDGFLDLTVTDKGIGIPSSEQQKIFDKFYRGSAPSVRRIRGSGIGLAITKHVAEMHGGEVLVKSEPGKGSTFTLRIPIRNTLDDLTLDNRHSTS
jgi:two-component system, OmpR family, phosphate regulon sensor histidine kinase PhoR